MLVLFLSLFGTRMHDGHTHVVGTATTMSDGQLVVNNKNGQTMAIQVDRYTWYHPIQCGDQQMDCPSRKSRDCGSDGGGERLVCRCRSHETDGDA